jgi:hypothetical protein
VGLVELALVGCWFARGVPLPPQLGFVFGFACVSASVVAVSGACPPLGRKALLWLVLPTAALLALSTGAVSGLLMAVFVTAALLFGATLLGSVIGGAVEHPGQLIFVAIVGSAMDVLSVLHPSGVSAAIAESETALSVVALPWPLLGTNAIVPLLGAGDIVFTSLYVAATRRHGLSTVRTLVALGVGYALTVATVISLEQSLPALPFLGLTFVAAQPASRRPSAEDRRRGALISAGVVVAVAVLLLRA